MNTNIKKIQKKSSITYEVTYNDGTTYTFNTSRLGDNALKLAEISLRDNKKYNNYFIKHNDYIELILYRKSDNKYYSVFIDIEDFDKIYNIYWTVLHTSTNTDLYAGYERGHSSTNNRKIYRMHNVIMNNNDKSIVYDHIDGNGLNNRKNNLRKTTQQKNITNITKNKGKVPIIGISYEEPANGRSGRFRTKVRINNNEKKQSFSVDTYGAKEALRLACEARNNLMTEAGYLAKLIDINSLDLDAIIEDLELNDK